MPGSDDDAEHGIEANSDRMSERALSLFRMDRTERGLEGLNALLNGLDEAEAARISAELAEAGSVYIGECKREYPFADVYREMTPAGVRDRCRHRPFHTGGFS